jgi:Uma2 family endonuclease
MQLSDLDLNKTYTYADYLQWTFEERLELIKGKVFKMTPAPNLYHQDMVMAISSAIYHYLKGKPCKVYIAPFDVRLPKSAAKETDKVVYTVVQPDVCVICDVTKLDIKGCIGAPDIVVEILSPGNNKKELRNKYEVYEESGVKEYWIVSPQDKTFLQYTLTDAGRYQASRLMTVGDHVTTAVLPDFVLDLEVIFENIHPEL